MKRQIPHGPEDLKCPLHKQTMAMVCHACPWWQYVRGKHPQSEEEIDRWDCSIAFLPMLLIENSQRQMQTAKAVNTVAAEMQKTDQQSAATISTLITLLNRAIDAPRQLGNGHAAPIMIAQD